MVIDSDGVILYTSDNMESFVALSPRDVIGHSLHDLVQSEQDSDTIRKNLQPEGKFYKCKYHFSEMKGDVGMSPHEKEGEQEDAYTKTETHSQPHPYIFVCCLCKHTFS